MATTNEYKLSHEQEVKIPVFTVFKNGAILKNIFIVNNNIPEIPTQEHEEIIIVGRHPNCNIMLTHPSISRFHLQILSNPSLQKLSVIDLSSVHGTWVSEKKIDPRVRVELKEGDSLRIGGSSRVYRLYWIPLSQAYDLETPYESVSDVPIPGEDIEIEVYRDENSMMIENKPIEEENNLMTVDIKTDEGKCEGNDHLSVVNQDIQSLDLVVEGMSSLFSDKSLVLSVKKEIPSPPPIPDNPVFSLLDENDELAESPPKDVTEHNEIPSRCNHFGTDSEKLSFPLEGISLDTLGADCHENYKGNASSAKGVACEIVMQRERSPRGPEEEFNHFVDSISSFSIDKEEKVEHAAQPFEETEIQQTDIESITPEALSDVEFLQGKQNSTGEQISNPLVDFISACSDGIPSASERIEETVDQKGVSVDYCEPCMAESGNSSLPAWEVVWEIADDKENQTPQSLLTAGGLPESEKIRNSSIRSDKSPSFGSIWSRRGKAASVVPLRTGRSRLEAMQGGSDSKAAQHYQESTEDKSIPKEMFTCLKREEELFTPDKKNFIPTSLLQQKSSKKEGTPDGVNQLGTTKIRLETRWGGVHSADKYHSQYSEVHKSISKKLFSCFDGEEEESYIPDKENFTPNTLLLKSIQKKGKLEEVKHSTSCRRSSSKINSIPKMHPEENLNALSNEENQMWRVLKEQKFEKQTTSENQVEVEQELVINKKRLAMKRVPFQSLAVDSVENSRSEMLCPSSATRSSSSVNYTHTVEKVNSPFKRVPFQSLAVDSVENSRSEMLCPSSATRSSSSVNYTHTVEKVNSPLKRVPFQSLAVDSVENSRSEMLCPSSATRSSSSVNYTHTVEKVNSPFTNKDSIVQKGKRGWTLVVDTTTLLNKNSRKALQLLQGLKGTRLIIPRMVIRELDCLKRQGSLFRRKPEACLVLEWIEKCITETTWWIHVQSSVEDGRLTAPTPPATPRSPFSQGSGGILMEILSPTTEDHILECALLCRKMRTDEQHVLLSDDLTLKIQAMAEGLICETVQEFRESLMNPFSERFLWADSSPRGQTWSVLDDVVLREKYSRYPSKKSSKGESAKGLKLILLHNSHYGHRSL